MPLTINNESLIYFRCLVFVYYLWTCHLHFMFWSTFTTHFNRTCTYLQISTMLASLFLYMGTLLRKLSTSIRSIIKIFLSFYSEQNRKCSAGVSVEPKRFEFVLLHNSVELNNSCYDWMTPRITLKMIEWDKLPKYCAMTCK